MARSIGRPMAVLVLSDEERSYLERQARRRRVARSLSDRCRRILRCADGLTNKAVAAELGVHEHTVGKWRRRFLAERIEGLSDEPRPGRPRTLTDEKVAEVIKRTLETTPADATHWSIRSMARETGLSHTTIRRIWAIHPSITVIRLPLHNPSLGPLLPYGPNPVGYQTLSRADRGNQASVNGGGNMYRGGGAKMYHGLGGSLSA